MKWARHPNLRKRPGRASRSPVGHRLYAESEDATRMTTPRRADCLPEVVGLELRNVVANYPFEKSRRFPGSSRILATETIPA
jgi:hypothetical protein